MTDCEKQRKKLFYKEQNCKNELRECKKNYEHYFKLWNQMAYYFRDEISLKDLDYKDEQALKKLAKGEYDD